MNRIIKQLTVCVFICLLCGCSDKEPKQYEKVKQTKSVALIDKYLEQFPDAPIEHIDTINMIRMNLIEDSVSYASIKASDNAIERYELEKKYAEEYQEGIYIAKVREMMERDKKAAEELEKQIEEERKESIKKMSIGELMDNNLLEEISFKSEYKYVAFGCGGYDIYSVKLNMKTGSAEINLREMLRASKNDKYDVMSDRTHIGTWRSTYVKRGDNNIKAFDIECGDIEIYTTEHLNLAYINKIDESAYYNFNYGNNVGALNITDVKKKISSIE